MIGPFQRAVRKSRAYQYERDFGASPWEFVNLHSASFGHYRRQPYMDDIVVWAWMLWSSNAVEHERYYGLDMDALV